MQKAGHYTDVLEYLVGPIKAVSGRLAQLAHPVASLLRSTKTAPFDAKRELCPGVGILSDEHQRQEDTIAVPAVLAAYNWPVNSDRYQKVQRFVKYLFNSFDKLQHPPYHPKWRDVNLAATIPGWTRFSAAQDMLDKIEQQQGATAQQQVDFDTFLSRQPHMPGSDAERDALFRDFLQWRTQQQDHTNQK